MHLTYEGDSENGILDGRGIYKYASKSIQANDENRSDKQRGTLKIWLKIWWQ